MIKNCLTKHIPRLLSILLLLFLTPSSSYRHALHKLPPRLQSSTHPYGFPRNLTLHSSPHDQPLHPSLPHLQRLHAVQLYGGMVVVGEYFAKILLGGQMLRTQIDTGSATLAVPMGECIRCRKGDRRYWVSKSNSSYAMRVPCEDNRCMAGTCSRFFGSCGKCSSSRACCAKESPDDCGFHLAFGDDSNASGCLVQDEMTWGGVSFPVVLGGILKDSKDFERKLVDGILGMAYPSLACNPSCVTPPLEAMAGHLKMKNLFQMCIGEENGLLLLGETDKSLTVGETKWVPLHLDSPPAYYTVKIDGDTRVGEDKVVLSRRKKAIVDSGTTLIVLSTWAFEKLARYFKSNFCHVNGLCGSQSWFEPAHCARLPSDQRSLLPKITIPLENGVDIELGPDEYMINYASKGKDFWCVGIMKLDTMSGGIDVILGNTVMKKYVTTFDRENHRVGFAESRGGCVSRNVENLSASLPTKDPAPSEPASSEVQNKEGKERHEKTRGDGSVCGLAQDCRECARVKNCRWNAEDKVCVRGRAQLFMCGVSTGWMKNPFVIVGAIVLGGILLLSIFVAVVRRSSGSTIDESEREELERPLAQNDSDDTEDTEEDGEKFSNKDVP